MKINISHALYTRKGDLIKTDPQSDTIGDLIYFILSANIPTGFEGSDPSTVSDKRKMVQLMNKFGCGGEVELSPEEISTILARSAFLVHTQVFEALDNLLTNGPDKAFPPGVKELKSKADVGEGK